MKEPGVSIPEPEQKRYGKRQFIRLDQKDFGIAFYEFIYAEMNPKEFEWRILK